jgi:hypothetical protein
MAEFRLSGKWSLRDKEFEDPLYKEPKGRKVINL